MTKMTFEVSGTKEAINTVVRFLREETTFSAEIRGVNQDKHELELAFGDNQQVTNVPYFMNWLHSSGGATLGGRVQGFTSRFKSISTQ